MAELTVSVTGEAPTELTTPLLVLQHFEDEPAPVGAAAAVDRQSDGLLSRVLEHGDFAGRPDETLVLYPRAQGLGPERILLVGVGESSEFTVERLRRAVGSAVREAERLRVTELALSLAHTERVSERMGAHYAALAATEGAVLAAWRFDELRAAPEDGPPPTEVASAVLIAGDDEQRAAYERGAEHGRITASAANLARTLATRPGNVATPTHLADVAAEIADAAGLDITVLDRADMEREELHALLAVARGSEEPPRFIVLEYRGGEEDGRPVALLGKGVTFDAGGISIKPAKKMEEMKYDMSGGAAVLAAMRAVAELELPINVVGIVPSTENLPSGTALKPGDVIRSRRGKTIEVINTDAEGRLILADALAYAERYHPAALLNAATLTGSCVVALGHHAIGLMGNREELVEQVRQAGERAGERCWPLPLWPDYRRQLDSDVADLKNTGGRPAGAITAGWFLREFAGDTPWAHLDVAGTAWRDESPSYLRKGATGVPTRLFVEWVRARAEA